jgi:tetratricopeptide (TPR) repeat protein
MRLNSIRVWIVVSGVAAITVITMAACVSMDSDSPTATPTFHPECSDLPRAVLEGLASQWKAIGASDVEMNYDRGYEYAYLGDYRCAIVEFSEYIGSVHTDANAYYFRGLAYASLGQSREAMDDFERSRAISPNANISDVYYNIGVIHTQSGEYTKALHAFDEAISAEPNGAAYFNRGIIRARLGETAPAEEDLRKACELEPKLC